MVMEQFVWFNKNFSNRDEVLSFVSSEMLSKGFVTEEYESKIIERESLYPTGFKLNAINIAICHTESQYAIKDALCIIKTENPVVFTNAENFEDLDVSLIFTLVFKDGSSHLKVLQKLSQLLLDNENISKITSITSHENLKEFFENYFIDTEEA